MKKCSPFNARLVFVIHFWPILVLVWMVHCRDSDPESERINTVLQLRGINPQIDHLLPCSHMSFLWSAWHSCTESIQKYSSYRAAQQEDAVFLFIMCQCLHQPRSTFACVCAILLLWTATLYSVITSKAYTNSSIWGVEAGKEET